MTFTVFAWLIVTPVSVVLLVLLTELALGLWPLPSPEHDGAPPRTAILMPAHDEAGGIAAIIDRLMGQIDSGIRLLVVADNCTDATAMIARQCGADVRERHDPDRRGKGFALDFGRDALSGDPPDCVIILDADCEVADGAIAQLAHEAVRRQRPVQGRYVMVAHEDESPLVQISNFAFLVKNVARQRGAARLGAPAVLGGTGMAFPWPLFARAPLASAALVEDLELGIALARQGAAPAYLDQAYIWSSAAAERDTLAQRTRWEHGYVQTATRSALPLIGLGVRRLSPSLLWLGLDLLVPPLALLMTIALGVEVVLAPLAFMTGNFGAVLCLTGLLTGNLLALALFWLREGRSVISPGSLVRIPGYILWKIPVYLNLLRRRQVTWERTRRSGDGQ